MGNPESALGLPGPGIGTGSGSGPDRDLDRDPGQARDRETLRRNKAGNRELNNHGHGEDTSTVGVP